MSQRGWHAKPRRGFPTKRRVARTRATLVTGIIQSSTPEGFPSKAKGCAYSRYPGKGYSQIINPGGVAYLMFLRGFVSERHSMGNPSGVVNTGSKVSAPRRFGMARRAVRPGNAACVGARHSPDSIAAKPCCGRRFRRNRPAKFFNHTHESSCFLAESRRRGRGYAPRAPARETPPGRNRRGASFGFGFCRRVCYYYPHKTAFWKDWL